MAELLALTRMSRRAGMPSVDLKALAESGRVPSLRAGDRLLFNPEAVTEALSRLAAESSARKEPRDANQ